ncbi:hypothetical protein ACTXT7_002274 [Hymenolepis weldensis]
MCEVSGHGFNAHPLDGMANLTNKEGVKNLMVDAAMTNEMKRQAVIVSIKAKHRNLEIVGFLKVARYFVCKVRKEVLKENNEDELAAKGKRKEHCQRPADLLKTPEFVRRGHGLMDENPGKSM